jgi:hypothetical protein
MLDPAESLLRPRFFVAPELGRERLAELVTAAAAERPNCVRATESSPPREMIEAALALRREQGLTEPMFRTLLRLRREGRS